MVFFLTDYSVCIGPTWSNLPWRIDTDLDPEKGDAVLRESFIFIAPGNCLGLPFSSTTYGCGRWYSHRDSDLFRVIQRRSLSFSV